MQKVSHPDALLYCATSMETQWQRPNEEFVLHLLMFQITPCAFANIFNMYLVSKTVKCKRLLKGQCPVFGILLVMFIACKNWCYQIWSHYERVFSKYHIKKQFLQQLMVAPHKQTLLSNTCIKKNVSYSFWGRTYY